MKSGEGSHKFIFLDRDGTIIRDTGYPHKPAHIEFLPFAIEGLLLLQKLGHRFIIVTNQAGIARGYYTIDDAVNFSQEVERLLKVRGIHIQKTYFCPHHPDFTGACECRKPKPGLARRAAEEFDISLNQSYFIGDKDSDIAFGRNCGGTTFLIVNKQYPSTATPHFNVKNLKEVYTVIMSECTRMHPSS